MNASQLSLFNTPLNKVVNVASVPHRSPFRYPGGKTWLVPQIRSWLISLEKKPTEFFEPFAGGAIVGLTVAFEGLAEHVTLIELDSSVASVWQAILYGDAKGLANRISTFSLTEKSVRDILSSEPSTIEDKAFLTILRNRVSHGGILAEGAGLIKNGEAGKGLLSRWYPDTLKKRILNIAAIREKITFIHDDGISTIKKNSERKDAAFFIDPPYTAGGKKAGSRLYTHFDIDHEALFSVAATVEGDFLMTYDLSAEVSLLATQNGFQTKEIAMQNTHLSKMTELLIGRNLDWVEKEGKQ